MLSFFTYGKFVVNSWQFLFSMKVIDMVRLEKDKQKSFEDILVYINNSSLLTSMNEFCENCKTSSQFFASFSLNLSKIYQDIPDPFSIPGNVKSYITNMLSRVNIDCVTKMDRISHMLIKKANQQEIEIHPDFEKKKQDILKSLKLNKLEIESYEKNTVSGSHCYIGEENLGKRLRATYFYRACTINLTTCEERLLKKVMYTNKKKEVIITDEDENNFYRNKYGINSEKLAINEFNNKMNVNIQPCGVFIDENLNYLVASPDGLIGKDAIVEVKCPFNVRNMIPEDAIKNKNIRHVFFDKNGNLLLKRHSQYFYQIQGELHITKRQYCYFIIWTQKGMVYATITRDDKFWNDNMESQLINFYENRMIPELINSQLFENNEKQSS
ncbi:uncharacterized protein LOC126893859 isoform X2 [Daktulosphaira vitifoliae]|nr:uncharacterized protein LOC126893859 isoform X2 [Daktulosphaira vitifoliae]